MKQMTLIEMDGFLKGKCIPRDLKVNETNAEYLVRKFGELESKIALLEVQLKLSEAAERAWESLMMQACGEDGPKSVADKFAEIESKLETALRECRSAGITIDNLEAKCAALAAKINVINELMEVAEQVNKLAQEETEKLAHERNTLAAENAMLKQRTQQLIDIISNTDNDYCMCGSAMKDHVHGGCGYPTGMFDYYYNQWLESDNKTPATDAFLAEVRASAIPDEATERDLFEEWVMEKIFISKTTLEGLRTDDGYRNSTLSGTDYNGMWSQWKAIRAAQLRQEAAQ